MRHNNNLNFFFNYFQTFFYLFQLLLFFILSLSRNKDRVKMK